MCALNSPLCFWDYCVERRARIINLTAKNAFKLHGSTPHTLTTGDEGNISNLCQYRNNTSNSGPPWMMDKCGPPRSRPIEVLIAHKLIL